MPLSWTKKSDRLTSHQRVKTGTSSKIILSSDKDPQNGIPGFLLPRTGSRLSPDIIQREKESGADEKATSSNMFHMKKDFVYTCKDKDFWLPFRTEKLQHWLWTLQKKKGVKFNVMQVSLKLADHLYLLDKWYGLPARAVLNKKYKYKIEFHISPTGTVGPISTKLVSPSLTKIPEGIIIPEEELKSNKPLTSEEILAKIEDSSDILESVDSWLEKAEYITKGETKQKVLNLRSGLQKISRPLSQTLDAQKKISKIGILIYELQEGSKTMPGGEKGVQAAARIFRALAELGEEIPLLGGIIGSSLVFLKIPETILKFGIEVGEMRIVENRQGLRKVLM